MLAALGLTLLALSIAYAESKAVPEPTRSAAADPPTTAAAALRIDPVPIAPPPAVESASVAPPTASAAPAPEHGSILSDAPPEAVPALLASAFDSDPIDHTWASSTSNAMNDGLREASVPGIDVRDLSCHGTMCRVDLRVRKDGAVARELFDRVCIGPDSKWATLHVGCYLGPPEVRGNGESDVSIFAFRDGRMP